jgi:hypothetical protein
VVDDESGEAEEDQGCECKADLIPQSEALRFINPK